MVWTSLYSRFYSSCHTLPPGKPSLCAPEKKTANRQVIRRRVPKATHHWLRNQYRPRSQKLSSHMQHAHVHGHVKKKKDQTGEQSRQSCSNTADMGAWLRKVPSPCGWLHPLTTSTVRRRPRIDVHWLPPGSCCRVGRRPLS